MKGVDAVELTTRCPDCGAVFSASVEQLKRRKGFIRCIECSAIFDGFDAVVHDADIPLSAGSGAVASSSGGKGSDVVEHTLSPVRAEPAVSPRRDEAPFMLSDPPTGSGDDHDTDPKIGHVAVEPALSGQSGPEAGPAIFVEPRRYRAARSGGAISSSGSRYAGGAGLRWVAVLLILVVGASLLMYAFRAQIAAEAPQLRPLLEKACDSLDCTVEYPQRIDRIVIMDSSLQAVPAISGGATSQAASSASSAPAVMQLTVVMRNTYDKAQQWPVLTLDLVDISGSVVSRRVFQPADYLEATGSGAAFGAGQEVRLSLRVPTEGLRVNGFQLGKFFPQKD